MPMNKPCNRLLCFLLVFGLTIALPASASDLDAIMAPTGGPAWKTDHVNGDAFQVGSSSPAAISGYPSITVPMGFIEELPVGISFFGKEWSEPVLIEIAYAYEYGTQHRKAPKFIKP